MKITKYGHACVVLEEQGKKLVIDPGEYTAKFGETDNIEAVVVTHVHHDHLHVQHLQSIIAANPGVKIFTTLEATQELNDDHAIAVKSGDEQLAGPFKLRFSGELHNAVHEVSPPNQNVAVLVNENFYYPGDSFTLPNCPVAILAVPAAAPWMKAGEAMDFIKTVGSKQFFRTHDGLLNQRGLASIDRWFNVVSEKFGPKYHALEPGESIEI